MIFSLLKCPTKANIKYIHVLEIIHTISKGKILPNMKEPKITYLQIMEYISKPKINK